jgi:hypothetical protein
VARDREQPRLRRFWSGLKARHRGECSRKGLSGEIKCLLWAGHPAAKEGKHRSEVPLVEDAERLRVHARREQKLGVGALLRVPHTSYMTISRDL